MNDLDEFTETETAGVDRHVLLREWVEALESGEYEQGFQYLRRRNDDDGTERYCCLGVLCEVAREHGLVTRYVADGGWSSYTDLDGFTERGALPTGLARLVDIPTVEGGGKQNPTLPGQAYTLAELNDQRKAGEDSGAGFPEIAAMLREALKIPKEETT